MYERTKARTHKSTHTHTHTSAQFTAPVMTVFEEGKMPMKTSRLALAGSDTDEGREGKNGIRGYELRMSVVGAGMYRGV